MRKAITHRVRDAAVALWHAAERAIHRVNSHSTAARTTMVEPDGRAAILDAISRALAGNPRLRSAVAVIVYEIDDFRLVEETHDTEDLNTLLAEVIARVDPLLRAGDVSVHLEGARFAVALSTLRRIDLEAAIQLSTRIQHMLAEPFRLDGRNVFVTASVGFSLAQRCVEITAVSLLRSANIALLEALRGGPNAIRSYSRKMHDRIASRDGLLNEAQSAIECGQVTAFFQPQIDLKTERVTGVEALARWHHPERGLIAPADFLPALEQAGLMRQLGHRILADSLTALVTWDQAGLFIPTVSINLSNAELRNPNLIDHIMMELDRHNLTPNRLVVEVLETVVAAQADNIISQNLAILAKMGCGIDLDDFGTGHASITAIRKLAIHRIKIDRSFVTHIDKDEEQQNMVAAILTMAERLGLETLAEGVETPDEQAVLAAMGCGHMQGYTLARPMSLSETTQWVLRYEYRHQATPRRLQVR